MGIIKENINDMKKITIFAALCALVMVKMPIISSIVDTLENKNMTDAELSAVIDAIDAGETSYPGVSQKDFDRLVEARRMVYSATFDHCAGIPARAKNKDLAKDFLEFMASDMGPYGDMSRVPTMAMLRLSANSSAGDVLLLTYSPRGASSHSVSRCGYEPLPKPMKRIPCLDRRSTSSAAS